MSLKLKTGESAGNLSSWPALVLTGLAASLAVALFWPQSPWDRFSYDLRMRLTSPFRPPVSARIVHFDLLDQDLENWGSAVQEYAGLGQLITALRAHGAHTIALDLILARGSQSDFAPLWAVLGDDVILGSTRSEKSKAPPQIKQGWLHLNSDVDGVYRRYAYPESLAWKAFQHWQKADSGAPAEVWLDYRAGWSQPGLRSFRHVTTSQLQKWQPNQKNLEGCLVLVGYLAAGTGDLGPTPLEKAAPKVMIHSTAINDLVQSSWRRVLPRWQLMLSVWVALAAGIWSLPLIWWWPQLPQATLTAVALLSAWWRRPRGPKVGRFRLGQPLGEGGFGSVYLARGGGRTVALKLISKACSQQPEFRRRFQREVRVLRQLNHPNIVRIFEHGESDGQLFVAMELLRGQSLRQLMERRPEAWDWPECWEILQPTLEAVAFAHSQGVLHRDLKPENMMVSPQGRVHLVDFGLAFDDQASQLTQSGEIFGTLDYLAPERIQGRANDARSDQYALGILAFEMLTGRKPFPAENPGEAILLRMTTEPTPLRQGNPRLPEELCQAIEKLYAREPEHRYDSVELALKTLEGLSMTQK